VNETMKSVKKVKNGKLLKALLVLAIVVGLSIAIPVAAAPDTATIPEEAKSMINSIVGLLQWMLYLVGRLNTVWWFYSTYGLVSGT